MNDCYLVRRLHISSTQHKKILIKIGFSVFEPDLIKIKLKFVRLGRYAIDISLKQLEKESPVIFASVFYFNLNVTIYHFASISDEGGNHIPSKTLLFIINK